MVSRIGLNHSQHIKHDLYPKKGVYDLSTTHVVQSPIQFRTHSTFNSSSPPGRKKETSNTEHGGYHCLFGKKSLQSLTPARPCYRGAVSKTTTTPLSVVVSDFAFSMELSDCSLGWKGSAKQGRRIIIICKFFGKVWKPME